MRIMEIQYIYSSRNWYHVKLRSSIAKYCRERGILTRIRDQEASVSEPIVIIDDYHQMVCRPEVKMNGGDARYQVPKELAELIECQAWTG